MGTLEIEVMFLLNEALQYFWWVPGYDTLILSSWQLNFMFLLQEATEEEAQTPAAVCDMCNKKFRKERGLLQHKAEKHGVSACFSPFHKWSTKLWLQSTIGWFGQTDDNWLQINGFHCLFIAKITLQISGTWKCPHCKFVSLSDEEMDTHQKRKHSQKTEGMDTDQNKAKNDEAAQENYEKEHGKAQETKHIC